MDNNQILLFIFIGVILLILFVTSVPQTQEDYRSSYASRASAAQAAAEQAFLLQCFKDKKKFKMEKCKKNFDCCKRLCVGGRCIV